jgi:pimeloyl-ACP methyl ester carboxylesterase
MPSSYLLINDLRYHYLHWNLGSGTPTFVLLHGLASNARIWELVAPYLAEAGCAVLAPDLRGHGLTDKPEGDYDFAAFTSDLAALFRAWDIERPLLVGHSWGAMLALDYAARFPYGPLAPAGLALVDGGFSQLDSIPNTTWESIRERLSPPRLAGMPVEDFLARVKTSNPHWQPDDIALQIILANFEVSPEETISPRLSYERHMQIVHAMWEFKTFEQYRRVKCPILLVPAHSAPPRSPQEHEFLALKESGVKQILSNHPQVRVNWMENSIHDIPLQHPFQLAQLLLEFAQDLR